MYLNYKKSTLALVVLLSWLCYAFAALDCPATRPCLCIPGIIDCEGHSFTEVPPFSAPNTNFHTLKLGNNSIANIKDSAFASLNISTLLLDRNAIVAIHSGAFNGVRAHLKTVNLAHNHLTSLPGAIGYLDSLQELDVSWNPIPGYKAGHSHGHHSSDGLTDSIMRQIGDSIIKFKFGDSSLLSWPRSLSHLNQLQELTLSGSNISYLPAAAFHGFEQTLKTLTIEYAALATIPLGISGLQKLEELHLDHLDVRGQYGQKLFGDDSMISAPFGYPISDSLRILSLNYDGLTTFPEVIKDLKVLSNISLDGNDLAFVSDEAIKLLKTANVTTLSLKNCNLKRVPGAISDLTYLLDLDLSQNKIRSIESTDLENLYHLRTLSLSENPLKYISDNSLCGLGELQTFRLYNTSLTEISQSLKNLRKLSVLDLQQSQIDCTCDISWIARWKTTCQGESKVEIQGECETIEEGIMEYINHRLPTCPGYGTEHFVCGGNCDSKK